MCDAICPKSRKYTLGPAPYFPPPVVDAYPCLPIEVDTPMYEPCVKPVIKNIVKETTINVPRIEYREKIVEVPQVEYRKVPVVKNIETPVFQDRYTIRDVEVPQKQYRVKPMYKVVDVPEIEYVDKFVKRKYKRFKYVPKEVPMPFRPKRKIYTEVPVPRYIPQTIEDAMRQSTMGPVEPVPYPHFNELPLVDGSYEPMPMSGNGMPLLSYPVKTETNQCCLNSLFCKGKKEAQTILVNPGIPMTPNHQLFPAYPHPYAPPFAYSPPFIVEENENNFCNCLIETTSNVLAASGVAIILAGKLTIDGINFLLKKTSGEHTTSPNVTSNHEHTRTHTPRRNKKEESQKRNKTSTNRDRDVSVPKRKDSSMKKMSSSISVEDKRNEKYNKYGYKLNSNEELVDLN